MIQVVGIGEMMVSETPGDVLVTYSLGSCIGLALYDPGLKIGGLVHCMLPLAKSGGGKSADKPCRYTDIGVTRLLQSVFDLGAERSRLIAKAAGAATAFDERGTFDIGRRNYTIMRKILWKNDILLSGEDIGGSDPRTLRLEIDTGLTLIRKKGAIRSL